MIISTPSKFLLEISPTPIYQRIINGFKQSLLELGHTVIIIDPKQISSIDEYLIAINREEPDFLLLTNPVSWLASYLDDADEFVFEKTNIPIIFIHHDNIFSNLYSSNIILKKLLSFQRIKEKSWHFCLEYDNFLDLRSLGINNTFSTFHASEFMKYSPSTNYKHEVSFLGHVLPSLSLTIEGHPFSHILQSHVWNRIVNLDIRLAAYATEFALEQSGAVSDSLTNFLSIKYFYISLLHLQSQGFRGEIIRRINNINVDIIGGDPAYLHGIESNKIIQKENIKYHPVQKDSYLVQKIYQNSQINLNITSLQFDDAVINRVIDIGAVGGFVLTDWRSNLEPLTGVHQEISYKSIEELNEKIAYYSHPDHYQERIDIAEALHQDIYQKCNYLSIVKDMISRVNTSGTTKLDSLRIDLGCGIWKPEGFIGVDIYPAVNVDVVANLNRRFPFSDNSADVIRAHDVVEHLDNRIHTMNELWRVSKPNALIDIRVPSTDGRGAFQDPTHVSFWNINSFLYYCVEYPEYLKLCHSYGFKGAFSIVSLNQEVSGDDVVHVHAVLKVVKDTQSGFQEYLDELRSINLLIFPNWRQPQAEISEYLSKCLEVILYHPQKNSISVLIVFNGSEIDNFESLILEAAFSLIVDKDIDVNDGEPNFIPIQSDNIHLLASISRYISAILPLGLADITTLLQYFPNVEVLENVDLISERWL